MQTTEQGHQKDKEVENKQKHAVGILQQRGKCVYRGRIALAVEKKTIEALFTTQPFCRHLRVLEDIFF